MTGDHSESPAQAEESPLTFPCEFPVKMMGRDEQAFHEAARAIVARHAPGIDASAFRATHSSKANFVSLTVTITAESQAQLDALYTDLSADEQILVAL